MKKRILVAFLLVFLFMPGLSQVQADPQDQQNQQEQQDPKQPQPKEKPQPKEQPKPKEQIQPKEQPKPKEQPQPKEQPKPIVKQQPLVKPQQLPNHQPNKNDSQNYPTNKQRLENHPENRQENRPFHDEKFLHEHQNQFRDGWLLWRLRHPFEQPSYFNLTVGEQIYYLQNIQPGVWYYSSPEAVPIQFIVPEGYVVIAQDQEVYPGDTVNSSDFSMVTNEAYSAIE